jgi:hypothetical protein
MSVGLSKFEKIFISLKGLSYGFGGQQIYHRQRMTVSCRLPDWLLNALVAIINT